MIRDGTSVSFASPHGAEPGMYISMSTTKGGARLYRIESVPSPTEMVLRRATRWEHVVWWWRGFVGWLRRIRWFEPPGGGRP